MITLAASTYAVDAGVSLYLELRQGGSRVTASILLIAQREENIASLHGPYLVLERHPSQQHLSSFGPADLMVVSQNRQRVLNSLFICSSRCAKFTVSP